MSQAGDIAAALAYQVKKEIAENYFGTRRELEEEREDLLVQGGKIRRAWEQEVAAPLNMIVDLLPDPEAGRTFRSLVGLVNRPEATPEATQQAFSEALGVCRLPLSFTSKGKYRALLDQLYRLAAERGRKVMEKFQALQKKIKLHNEEVIKFGSSYNLSEILAFIKAIEGADEIKGVLGENLDPRAVPELERKLSLKTLPPVDLGFPSTRPLPEYQAVRETLHALADRSYRRYTQEIKACLRPGEPRRAGEG